MGVKPYDKNAQKLIAILVAAEAEVKDHPADLINVAIEELVKQRYELPAFSTLDRLIGHVRSLVNNRLFARVGVGLSTSLADLFRSVTGRRNRRINCYTEFTQIPTIQRQLFLGLPSTRTNVQIVIWRSFHIYV